MQLIVFNRIASIINRHMEAASLRAAYLLGARPILAGETAKEIYFRRDRSDAPLLLKLDMLILFNQHDEEYKASLVNMRKLLKSSPSKKLKTKEQIVAWRKLESAVLEMWNTASTALQDITDAKGFSIVRELEENQIFGFLTTGVDPEKEGTDEIKASDLMQLYVVEENEKEEDDLFNTPELFFLGSEFLEESYEKPPILSATHPEAANIASIYLHHAFTLPWINALTASELQAARTGLHAAGNSAFNKAVDEWCRSCYGNEPPAGRISIFQEEVLPAAAILGEALEKDSILQLCRRQHTTHSPVEVWIGEMPVLQLWRFYRHFKVLGDETWQKLEAQKDNPEYSHRRWPVMMLKSSEIFVPIQPEDELKSVKKYLSIE